MKTIFILLLLFLVIGLCVRTYNIRTRVVLIGIIVAMLLFEYLT